MTILLTVTGGPHTGRSFRFDRHDTFLVGRAPEAHFSLPDDAYFSRMHCLIEVNPPLCRLTDLASRNGTFVNGNRVQSAQLNHGDEVRGGRTTLKVSITADAPGQTLVLPSAEPATPATIASEDPWATLPPGQAGPSGSPIPGYRLVAQLGAGGMGVVYRAVRDRDQAEVAVKTIKPGVSGRGDLVQRFLREVAILERLRHPNIVAFHESGEAGGLLYFVMELVPGTDAAAVLRRDGPLPVARAVGLVLQALAGLEYAHDQGFVHRDVKPANLLLTSAPSGEVVKLADFGLARAYQDSPLSGLTLSGAAAGTPHYMPPEQVTDFRGARPPADQFSAMATLYHLLTKAYIYDTGSTEELFRKLLTEDPVPLRSRRADVPEALARVVHRGLARRPDQRYPHLRDLSRALLPFAG